jgi:serine protease Do
MKSLAVMVLAGCAACALAPQLVAEQHISILNDDPALLTHASAGFLGIDFRDIDNDRAAQLKLKVARGAEIVTVDHDAPACKAGLLVHDVILQVNGQIVEGEAQLRRLLLGIPPGRSASFLISRDGQQQSVTVQLADRTSIEAGAWPPPTPVAPDDDDAIALPNGPSGLGSSFLSALGMNPAYTGLEVDMLGPQLADFFGVHDGQGLLVKRVDDNSPGSVAGLRAGDVITKVNGRTVATTSQWLRTIHANRGKQVQLTVYRDRREAVITLTAGRSKQKGALDWPAAIAPDLLAHSVAQGARQIGADASNEISSLRGDFESLRAHNLQ